MTNSPILRSKRFTSQQRLVKAIRSGNLTILKRSRASLINTLSTISPTSRGSILQDISSMPNTTSEWDIESTQMNVKELSEWLTGFAEKSQEHYKRGILAKKHHTVSDIDSLTILENDSLAGTTNSSSSPRNEDNRESSISLNEEFGAKLRLHDEENSLDSVTKASTAPTSPSLSREGVPLAVDDIASRGEGNETKILSSLNGANSTLCRRNNGKENKLDFTVVHSKPTTATTKSSPLTENTSRTEEKVTSATGMSLKKQARLDRQEDTKSSLQSMYKNRLRSQRFCQKRYLPKQANNNKVLVAPEQVEAVEVVFKNTESNDQTVASIKRAPSEDESVATIKRTASEDESVATIKRTPSEDDSVATIKRAQSEDEPNDDESVATIEQTQSDDESVATIKQTPTEHEPNDDESVATIKKNPSEERTLNKIKRVPGDCVSADCTRSIEEVLNCEFVTITPTCSSEEAENPSIPAISRSETGDSTYDDSHAAGNLLNVVTESWDSEATEPLWEEESFDNAFVQIENGDKFDYSRRMTFGGVQGRESVGYVCVPHKQPLSIHRPNLRHETTKRNKLVNRTLTSTTLDFICNDGKVDKSKYKINSTISSSDDGTGSSVSQDSAQPSISPDAMDSQMARVLLNSGTSWSSKITENRDSRKPEQPRPSAGKMVRRKTIDPKELPFLQRRPVVKSHKRLESPKTGVGAAVKRFGGRKSIIEKRKDQLERRWSESKAAKHVKKIKWGVCHKTGTYKKQVVVDVQYR